MVHEKVLLITFLFYQNGSGHARIFPPGLIILATASREDEIVSEVPSYDWTLLFQ